MTASEGCGGHTGISEEVRALLRGALDRIDPALDRLRTELAGRPAGASAETCAVCPVCAVLAALRGERTELAARLAEHAADLLAALRAALEEGGPTAPSAAEPPPASTRRVEHIRVERRAP
jgi:hypothetical protein